jgi:hypothetical protein
MRALLIAVFFLLAPAAVAAQVEITSNGIHIHLNGRVHAQYRTTSVDGQNSSEFLIRRARFVADVEISDLVFGRVEPDYGGGKITLKDAYLRLNFDPGFRLSFGQFKRAFDIFQLYSTTQILTIERAGLIPGVDSCLVTVCSWTSLILGLQYSARDVGVLMDGRPSNKVEYRVSVTNGSGPNRSDQNSAKSYAGRVVVHATSNVRISGNVSVHDYIDETTGDEHAIAYGGDVEIGRYGDEFHLQAGLVAGENWRDLDTNGDPATFVTAQSIISYLIPIVSDRGFTGIEPHFRVSWADPNTDAASVGGWLFTPGVALRLTGRNKLLANVDVWSPATGTTDWSFKFQSNLYF